MTNWPWWREIPWYKKVGRVLHCLFTMMPEIVWLDYQIEDMEYAIQEMHKVKGSS